MSNASKILWISHRGESVDAPENTLAAFQLSRTRQTDGMECDIRLTKDQQVVVSHDEHTGRMGDQLRIIEQSTLEELRQINLSGGNRDYPNERIPLFADTLPCLGENRVYFVELKPGCPALVAAAKPILEASEIKPEQIVLICFDQEMIRLAVQQMPQFRTLLLTGFTRDAAGKAHPTADELIETLRELHTDGVDIYADELVIDRDYVQRVQAAGFLFTVWTVDNPGQAARFCAMNVDAITSNCAARLRDQLQPML